MAAVRRRHHVRLTGSTFALALTAWLTAFGAVGGGEDRGSPSIVVEPGRYGPYYHLRLELTAPDIDFAGSDRHARSGGQFEIRLRRERFPVPAPNCRGTLILRMPWTPPGAPDAPAKIVAKRALLDRILALADAPGDAVTVVLELNPYVEVVRRVPLRLRLTQCNVFFRQAAGGYVAHTGPA